MAFLQEGQATSSSHHLQLHVTEVKLQVSVVKNLRATFLHLVPTYRGETLPQVLQCIGLSTPGFQSPLPQLSHGIEVPYRGYKTRSTKAPTPTQCSVPEAGVTLREAGWQRQPRKELQSFPQKNWLSETLWGKFKPTSALKNNKDFGGK